MHIAVLYYTNNEIKYVCKLKMTEPPSYAPFLIDSNGHSYEEFTMRLEKVTVLNSQSVSAENVGSWKASLNSPIVVKDAANMTHFSAVTVYRIVTVLVNKINTTIHYIICLSIFCSLQTNPQ